ncbi:MAG: hypothetical protein ACKN9T_10770, partial [Candidatus Methylumidiphilus sp.]
FTKSLWLTFMGFSFGYCLAYCNRTRLVQIAFFLALFLLPSLVFFNLHRIHSYYQSANAIFLSIALGLALTGAMESTTPHRKATVFALYLAMILSFIGSSYWYFSLRSTYSSSYQPLASYLQERTQKDSVIVIAGLDWSAEVPYLAERKAVMLRDGLEDAWLKMLHTLTESKYNIGAYLQCGPMATDVAVANFLNIKTQPDATLSDCKIYVFEK